MQAIKEVVSCLIKCGMDAAEAAALVALAISEGSTKKRSSGAERAFRYRERKASLTVTKRDEVTPCPDVTKRDETVTNRDNVTSATLPLESKKERKSVGHALRDDWKPDESDHEYGRLLGLSRKEVEGCAEDMRLWARGNANRAVTRKADWRSTFRGWMRREAPKIVRQRGGPQGFKWNGNIEGVI